MKFIADVLKQCNSRQEFESRLRAVNLQLDISPNGIVRGVMDRKGKSTSWRRCGVSEADLLRLMHREEMTHVDKRLKRLEKLQQINQKSQDRANELER